jgi:hypothetical protein
MPFSYFCLMKVSKQILNFYINSSIHVALACFALVKITDLAFHISIQKSVAGFAFFGTIVGYNFVKYDALARAKKLQMKAQLKSIAVLSFFALIASIFYFIKLEKSTQLVSVICLGLTLLYTLPFFPNQKNARNFSGLKIYIVTICWVGVTLVLPVLNANINFGNDFYIIAIQRFIVVFVLILIFEIIDLKSDDPNLKTIPQQIGVPKTKILGLILLVLFWALEFVKLPIHLHLTIVVFIAPTLLFSNINQSKYYTSLLAESIPALWWFLMVWF